MLIGVRDNGRGVQAYGINLAQTRLFAFALSGFIAGVAGALFSYQLGTRKPDPELYRRALARYGAETAFLLDDALPNVLGAREAGLTAVHLEWVDGVARTDGVVAAIDAYAGRHV